jgi:hypothetical protein
MTKKNTNRLAGHALPYEGRIADRLAYWGSRGGEGATRCSCGEESPVLPSTSARQRWHREHKDAIRAKAGGDAA